MSGKPNQTPSDAQRNKIEYMEYIQKQARINQVNLQANQQYLANGTLPATAQILDNRTTSEILADGEKLKMDLANEFKAIGSLQFGLAIFDKVINSKLNVDNKFLRFVAQNAPDFVAQLQKKYKYGIAGDTDDVDTIVQFLERLFTDKNSMFQSVKGFIQSNTGTLSQKSEILKPNDLDGVVETLQEYLKRLTISKTRAHPYFNEITKLIKIIRDVRNVIPTNQELQVMLNMINDDKITPFDEYNLGYIFDTLKELPKANEINTLLNFLGEGIEKNDDSKIKQSLENMLSLFKGFHNPEFVDKMLDALGQTKGELNAELQNIKQRQLNQEKAQRGAMDVRVINPPDDPVRVFQASPNANTVQGIENWFNETFGGNGLRRGRIRGRGIAVVEKPPTFIGFGINEINIKKLNDKGIFTIRRNTRSNIQTLPTRHVSDKFRKVINTFVGGGMPKIDDINGLDEDEKNYLYKIVKASNLEDKLSIPAPKKDELEKQVHQFEVMKGQILSGNDSRDLIKKFKLLTVKLCREGYLPKAEVNELLEQLVLLGY